MPARRDANSARPAREARRGAAGSIAVRMPTGRHRKRGRRRRARRIEWRRFLPVLACAALFVYGGVRLILYAARSLTTKATNEALEELYASESESDGLEAAAPVPTALAAPVPTTLAAPAPSPSILAKYQWLAPAILPDMQELYARNDDLAGWIKIPGLLSLPVVYRDNRYYLTRDFYKKKSASGTLFLDEAHPVTEKTQMLVVHGHNMHDGSMFGMLAHYRNATCVWENGIVYFSTLYRKEKYAVVAVLVVPGNTNAQDYIAYTGTPRFETAAQFDAYMRKIRSRSLYDIPIAVDATDAILTLSTCLNDDDRLLVVCRRLRDGETERDMRGLLEESAGR